MLVEAGAKNVAAASQNLTLSTTTQLTMMIQITIATRRRLLFQKKNSTFAAVAVLGSAIALT